MYNPFNYYALHEADCGFCLVNPDNRVVFADSRWLSWMGLEAEHALGMSVTDLLPTAIGLVDIVCRHVRAGVLVRLPRYSGVVAGRKVWWTGVAEPVAMLGGTGVLLRIRDVTEEVSEGAEGDSPVVSLRSAGTATQRLALCREAANLAGWAEQSDAGLRDEGRDPLALEAVLHSMADGVVICNPQGGIVQMNAAAGRMLGCSLEEPLIPVTNWLQRLKIETAEAQPFPPERFPLQRALEGETTLGTTLVLRAEPDRRVWLSASAAPIRTDEGKLLGAVSTFVDVTSLHELQEQQDDLVRSLYHDLQNPLTAALGHAQILQRFLEKGGAETRALASAQHVVSGVKRMSDMIQQLVETTRLESGQLVLHRAPTDLGALLSETLQQLSGALEVDRVRVDLPRDLPEIDADSTLLQRICANLISNALKYSQPGSEVLVTAEWWDDTVIVSVADRGEGVAPEDLTHLFDRFYRGGKTRRTEGLGLGLYVSRKLVEAHGGLIWVESRAGEGSTFRFNLPVAAVEERMSA